jgi:hypothetical protein
MAIRGRGYGSNWLHLAGPGRGAYRGPDGCLFSLRAVYVPLRQSTPRRGAGRRSCAPRNYRPRRASASSTSLGSPPTRRVDCRARAPSRSARCLRSRRLMCTATSRTMRVVWRVDPTSSGYRTDALWEHDQPVIEVTSATLAFFCALIRDLTIFEELDAAARGNIWFGSDQQAVLEETGWSRCLSRPRELASCPLIRSDTPRGGTQAGRNRYRDYQRALLVTKTSDAAQLRFRYAMAFICGIM